MALKIPRAWLRPFLIVALSVSSAVADREWEPASFLEFAEHLYSQQDFLRAAGEFERYLSVTQNRSVNRDSILLKTAFCYVGAKDFTRALDFLKKAEASSDSSLAREARLNSAFVRFRMGDYRQSIQNLRQTGRDSIESSARLLLALNYLHLKQWRETATQLREVKQQDTLSPHFRKLRAADQAGLDLNYKNPYWAGAISVAVPGSGKMYAGRFKDGLFSLALVGLTGVLAYEGFSHDGWKSTPGWIFGTLSMGFYSGNIYGSVLAARQANSTGEKRILEDISFSVNARVPF